MGTEDQEERQQQKNVFGSILENYNYLNKTMVEEIDIASAHGGITGNYREEMWVKFFRSIIPLKYSLAQGVIIIDSHKNRSREVDIAVYDEQYTPYVFQYNTLKFIPIEAVVVAIECKSTDWDDDKLKVWANSIQNLKPRKTGIARMVGGYSTGITNTTQQRSRPILILASNLQRTRESAIDDIEKELEEAFDFILLKKAEAGSGGSVRQFDLRVRNEGEKLGWWGAQLNGAGPDSGNLSVIPPSVKDKALEGIQQEINKELYSELQFIQDSKGEFRELENTLAHLKVPGNPLLTLNFQLNQLLMLLNNPMLFPHFAYAKAFREIAEETAASNDDKESGGKVSV